MRNSMPSSRKGLSVAISFPGRRRHIAHHHAHGAHILADRLHDKFGHDLQRQNEYARLEK